MTNQSRRTFLNKLGLFSIFAPKAIDHYVWRAERKVIEARSIPNPDYMKIMSDCEMRFVRMDGVIPIIYRRQWIQAES